MRRWLRFVLLAVFVLGACSRLNLTGTIQKVRVYETGPKTCAVIVDFRLNNPSKVLMMVREVTVEVEKSDGTALSGSPVSDGDAEQFLQSRPEQGPKYNPALAFRTRLRPAETQDFMVAAGFDVPAAEIESRKAIRLLVTDADGLQFSIGD